MQSINTFEGELAEGVSSSSSRDFKVEREPGKVKDKFMRMVAEMQDEIDERETRITACLESEFGDTGGSAGTVSLPIALCKAEEDFI